MDLFLSRDLAGMFNDVQDPGVGTAEQDDQTLGREVLPGTTQSRGNILARVDGDEIVINGQSHQFDADDVTFDRLAQSQRRRE